MKNVVLLILLSFATLFAMTGSGVLTDDTIDNVELVSDSHISDDYSLENMVLGSAYEAERLCNARVLPVSYAFLVASDCDVEYESPPVLYAKGLSTSKVNTALLKSLRKPRDAINWV